MQHPVVSTSTIKKLSVNMLWGYVASYKLPVTVDEASLTSLASDNYNGFAVRDVPRMATVPSQQ